VHTTSFTGGFDFGWERIDSKFASFELGKEGQSTQKWDILEHKNAFL